MGVSHRGLGIGDAESTSSSSDLLMSGDDGTSRHAGAAGPGLTLNTTLVGAHLEGAVGKGFDEIDIGSLGTQIRQVADASPLPFYVEMGEVFHLLHIMGHTGVEQGAIQHRTDFGFRHILHAQTDHATAALAVPREDLRVVRAIGGEETELSFTPLDTQQMGKDSDAAATVATHFGWTTVGIIIAHLEIEIGRSVMEGHQAVGTYAKTAMAEGGDGLLGELGVVLAGIDEDKIVAGSVEFIERYFH